MKLDSRIIRLAKERSPRQEETDSIPLSLRRTFEALETGDFTPPVDFLTKKEDLIESIASRKALYDRCLLDPVEQQKELKKSKESIVYWVNHWVWTHDPRFAPGATTIPFDLFKRQEEYLLWRQERRTKGEQGIIDKSRDMGVTWLNVIAQLHSFLFEPGYKGAIGSRKASLVDRKGDPDSIFEKFRFALKCLPYWMRPNTDNHIMKSTNLDNGSVLTGEGGDSMGRGGRNSTYDVDEAAFIERPMLVDAAVSENSPVVFWTSTANIWAPGNTFDQKINAGNIPVFVFDWRDDPRKDDNWYRMKCKTLDPAIVASEIDRDRDANLTNNVIPSKWVRAAIDFSLARTREMRAGVDIADTGNDSTVVISGAFPRAQYVDVLNINDVDPLKTADAVTRIAKERQIKTVIYDPIGVGSGTGGQWRRDPLADFKQIKFVASASVTYIEDFSGKKTYTFYPEFDRHSNDTFENLKAEAWWLARQRFWKTYKVKYEGATYPDHELVSIPNNATLIRELSQVLFKTDSGKIQIESKKEMKARGLKSPDHADALIMFLFDKLESYSPDWITNL